MPETELLLSQSYIMGHYTYKVSWQQPEFMNPVALGLSDQMKEVWFTTPNSRWHSSLLNYEQAQRTVYCYVLALHLITLA